MTTFTQLTFTSSDPLFTDRLRLAVAAYLARFKDSSREHTESDLCCYLSWCAEYGLDPLAARRPHLKLYIRWMQEIRRYKPSTVSRPVLGHGRVLPHLRPGRHPRALTRRARPPPRGSR
jgi:integrase/recombinase XerD